MQDLNVIEVRGKRVLTTPQLADAYETTRKKISYNFQYNKKRYVKNKHYIELSGQELMEFKSRLEIQDTLKYAKILYLWTEKGALLHAKSLNTDKAWEVYDYLVDFYFRANERDLQTAQLEIPVIQEVPRPSIEEQIMSGDEKQIGYNRGVIMGVYRQELEGKANILEIYNLLSTQGKSVVAKLLFGEVMS